MFSSPSKVLREALKQSEERIAKGINPTCRESSWNRGSEAVAHRGNENLFHITEGRGCSLHNGCSEIRQVSLSSNHPIFKASPRKLTFSGNRGDLVKVLRMGMMCCRKLTQAALMGGAGRVKAGVRESI